MGLNFCDKGIVVHYVAFGTKGTIQFYTGNPINFKMNPKNPIPILG